jgi:phage terminase large subunit
MGLEFTAREIIDHFSPKQLEAFEATFTHRYIMYGGARGGGKSRLLRWWLLLFLLYQHDVQHNERVKVGLFCETYRDLQDRQISKIATEFPPQLGRIKDTLTDGLAFHLVDSLGGGILALRNLDDPSKYQGAEFAAIGVDELTKIQKSKFDILRGSLRFPGISHTVFMGTTNPGDIGHLWVKQLWIDRDFPPELRNMADQFKFIPALPSDNSHLDQTYWDELNSLPDNLRRAWVDGDWNVFAGQAFTVWRDERHIIEPFDIPDGWQRWRGVDWGYAAPMSCLWLTKDPDTRRIYVYRELYGSGITDDRQAETIKEMTPPTEKINMTYADPSMWAKKSQNQVITSSADEYTRYGVPLTRAENDRIGGKRKVDRLLSNAPDGQPGLMVFNTCNNLIRTLPALPYDKVKQEDIDTDAEDHVYDALRYALTSITTEKSRPAPASNPWLKMRNI